MIKFSNKSSRQPINLHTSFSSSSSHSTTSTKIHTPKKNGLRSSNSPTRPLSEMDKLNVLVHKLPAEARKDLAKQALSDYDKKHQQQKKKTSNEGSSVATGWRSSRSITSSKHHLEDISGGSEHSTKSTRSIKSNKSKPLIFDDNSSTVSSLSMSSAFRSSVKRAHSMKL